MTRIFLCHANEDKAQVRDVYQRLKAEGFQPWLDEEDLLPGQLWEQEIPRALRASDFILIFFSQTSVAKRGYVQREMKLALDAWMEIPAGQIHTIPVKLDDCTIPARFKPFQWVDLFRDNSWERLIRAIRFGLEQRQQSVPASRLASQQDATGTVATRDATTAPLSTGIIPVAMDFSPHDIIGAVGNIDTRLGSMLPPSLVSLDIEFVLVPAGEFRMGFTDNDYHARSDEQPVHTVHISQSFYLGKSPVTQAQWESVMGNNPSHFKGDPHRPVESISWDDVQEFIRKLNERDRGIRYRLPTEAEWEYAARAGSKSVYSFGDDREQLGEYAWYEKNSGGTTHPVGQLKPNAWGLYDMHGNVWEWVQDWHGDYPDGTLVEPQGATSGSSRVQRGGNWHSDAGECRSARRSYGAPTARHQGLGFRLVQEVSSSLTLHYAPRA